jgi:tRNA modification GTPase
MVTAETIFALSSGQPPAAIGVIRVSGPEAGAALARLAGRLPVPRRASHRTLRDDAGEVLDDGLVLWLPGPNTATGEDLAEIHCHGGRAVTAAIESALAGIPGLRRATPGEFTRRAFANGRVDLAEAEGLADLLSAETELQRRSALAMAGGALSRTVERWRERLLALSAAVEAVLDFSDEDDVAPLPPQFAVELESLIAELGEWIDRPAAERLKEGITVVLAGPPNVGKSTLFNALVESEAAITAPIAGTTRDVLVRSIALAGVPFQFLDTAGLNDGAADAIEAIGIERAHGAMAEADLVFWLGDEHAGPTGCWEIDPRIDQVDHVAKARPRHRVSALTGEGLAGLRKDLIETARTLLPKPGDLALNLRQRGLLAHAIAALREGLLQPDLLLFAENLRQARVAFDELTGRAATEDMLDALFSRFCIGK